MKNKFIVYPFLFAIYPILAFFAHNLGQAYISDMLPLLLIATAVVLLLIFIFGTGDRAGIAISLFLLLFFAYGHIYQLGLAWHIEYWRHRYLLPVFFGGFLFAVWLIIRTRRDFQVFRQILNVMGFVLVAVSLVNIGYYKLKTNITAATNSTNLSVQNTPQKLSLKPGAPLRDIYYIILDGYAGSQTLKDDYAYDNSEFTNYLGKHGFFVASKSLSNYAMTSLSLASSLNMKYSECSVGNAEGAPRDENSYALIQNNEVMRSLKSIGYKFLHFSSGVGATDRNMNADLDFRETASNEFLSVFLQTTILLPFSNAFFSGTSRKRILYTFYELAKVPEIDGPKFVVAHIIAPHPPFVFNADGEPAMKAVLALGGLVWMQKENYISQLKFVNAKTTALIEDILLKSKIEPIIILQADHGPAASISVGNEWHSPGEKSLQERMRIFNAYHLPGGGNKMLYKSITPVNTFRAVFNIYFAGKNDLLTDRAYFSNYNSPCKLTDVTDIVAYN